MNPPTTELLLRANGIQPAFGFEFGMDSPRANEARAGDPYRQANVSFSFVQAAEGDRPSHAHRLRHGRRALAFGVRA